MTISRPTYCSREDVKNALDVHETWRSNVQVDSAIESASDSIEGQLNRVFYPTDASRSFDWPNFSYSYPWRLWLDQNELAAAATSITSGGVSIPINNVNFEPINDGPPYDHIELRRDLTSAFTSAATPQRSVVIVGTYGYWLKTTPAGTLAVALNDTTGTVVKISNGAAIGVGDVILIGTERMLVTDRQFIDTTVVFTGPTDASAANDTLAVADGTLFFPGEVILLDSERMLIVDISGNTLAVKRAWDGTRLAIHTSGTIYASRQLTVVRGALGTTAATHLISVAIAKFVIPAAVRELAIAEAENGVLQKASGYARTVGSGANVRMAGGGGLEDIRDKAYASYGRKGRSRTV